MRGTKAKIIRRERLADPRGTPPEIAYSLSDTGKQEQLLRDAHTRSVAAGWRVQIAKGLPYNPGDFDLADAVRRMLRRVDRYYGATSKYAPHQGYAEKNRRVYGPR
jgi:hypothetical protein